jgi:asparagine synthase (glutamine-hydrolysing)
VSGFFGMLRLDGQPVNDRFLHRLAVEMSFRGPDGTNVSREGHIGSCFAFMRTGPAPQASQQPVCCGDRLRLWGDIRLDARRELRNDLAMEHCLDASSEELLLRAWTKWGPAALEHVIGDFSFALWDANDQTLWCARDFVGARPFYYASSPGVFCFSNTLRILRFVPEVSAELDELFIADYLSQGWNSEPSRTVYRDIRRLPAGHCLQLSNGVPRQVRRFRKLPIEELLRFKDPGEYLDLYRDLLTSAVSDRLPDGSTALYLSGGLDSSAVCAAASRLAAGRGQKEKLKAFTVGWSRIFEDPEPPLAELTARHLGIAHEVFQEDGLHPYQQADTPAGATPEPDDEIFFARARKDYQQIAAHSNVVLSGDGGDDVLTGQSWPYLLHLFRRREWKTIATEFGGYFFAKGTIPPLRAGFRSRFLRLFQTKDPFAEYPQWLNPDFESRTNLRERWLALNDHKNNLEHSVHAEAYEALHDGYWANILEMEETGWSRVCLETRAPLLDLRLLSFLLRLPPVPWCMHKVICRQAMKDFLPESVINRPKTPMSAGPMEECLKPGDWIASFANAAPNGIDTFVNWSKWCETLYRSKGSLRLSILRPASLFYWLKAIESDLWIQYSETRGA